MNVKIKPNQDQDQELEDKLPIDRIVEVNNGVTYLYDKEFKITEDMIGEVL